MKLRAIVTVLFCVLAFAACISAKKFDSDRQPAGKKRVDLGKWTVEPRGEFNMVHCADGSKEIHNANSKDNYCFPYPRVMTVAKTVLLKNKKGQAVCEIEPNTTFRTAKFPKKQKNLFSFSLAPTVRIPGCEQFTKGYVAIKDVIIAHTDGLALWVPSQPDFSAAPGYSSAPDYGSQPYYGSYPNFESYPYASYPDYGSMPDYESYPYYGSYPY